MLYKLWHCLPLRVLHISSDFDFDFVFDLTMCGVIEWFIGNLMGGALKKLEVMINTGGSQHEIFYCLMCV